MNTSPRSGRILAALVLVVLAASCAPKRPVYTDLARTPDRPDAVDPVLVVVPGITGSRLIDRASGKLAWGNAKALFFPRDGGYDAAVPLDAPETAPYEADGVLRTIRIPGFYVFEAYRPVARLFADHGWIEGDFDRPADGENLFFHDYDWRMSAFDAIDTLAERLARLADVRGSVSVAFVAQSDAALIARWIAKYGRATLDEAERGISRPIPGVTIDTVILVGNANGGAMRMLRELDRGRTYFTFSRKLHPELLFTFPSMFEALPAFRDDLFVDTDGDPLDIDLFDAESWRTYEWSAFSERARRRLSELPPEDLRFGRDENDRLAYLQAQLDRARRMRHALATDAPGFRDTRYYLIQSRSLPTASRAVLAPDGDGGWETLFQGDRRIDRDPILSAVTTAPGDNHATAASQEALSPQELRALAAPVFLVADKHFEVIKHPASQKRILEFLKRRARIQTDEPGPR